MKQRLSCFATFYFRGEGTQHRPLVYFVSMKSDYHGISPQAHILFSTGQGGAKIATSATMRNCNELNEWRTPSGKTWRNLGQGIEITTPMNSVTCHGAGKCLLARPSGRNSTGPSFGPSVRPSRIFNSSRGRSGVSRVPGRFPLFPTFHHRSSLDVVVVFPAVIAGRG